MQRDGGRSCGGRRRQLVAVVRGCYLTDLVGRFPRADLVVEGEGHLIPVEEPMTVAAIVAGVY